MKYADIKYFDVINGSGIRVSIFVSGCSHHCEHCFNYKAWNPEYGLEFDNDIQDRIFNYIEGLGDTIDGISLLGGDPTYYSNINPLCNFLDKFKRKFPKKDIWIWSGYTWEEIIKDKKMLELISKCDVLIDGKFKEELKDVKLRYKGSSNQRVIKIKESLDKGEIVIY